MTVGMTVPIVDMRVSYDWDGWKDASTPSANDKIQLYHRAPDGAVSAIAVILKTEMTDGFGRFYLTESSHPAVFTPGTHEFFVRASIYDSGSIRPFHVSPNSNQVIKVFEDLSPGTVRINNNLPFHVSEIRTSANGGVSWSASYGEIPPYNWVDLAIPQNNMLRIRTSYWSEYHNDWIHLGATEWSFSAVINVPDPWPGVIVGSIWRGYSGEGVTWEMEFFSNFTFRVRAASPGENFTPWSSGVYSLNTRYPSSYTFFADGEPATYYIENPIDHSIDQLRWGGVTFDRYQD